MKDQSGSPRSNGDAGATQARRWHDILDAAADVFYEKGYGSTTIQDIADRVGMLKGSLYYYIRTKEDFLFGIIDEVQMRGLQLLEEGRSLDGEPAERLHRFIKRYAAFTLDNRVKASVFDRDFRSLSPERRADLVRNRDLYDQFLRALLTEGVTSGVLAADLDVVVVGNVIFQMMNSAYHWYSPGGTRSTEEIATILADLVVNGVAGPRR